MKPINKRVVIELAKPQEVTAGGIFIPERQQEAPSTGKVIAVADDCTSTIAAGDTVLFNKYCGNDIEINERTVKIVHESDIIGIFDKEEAGAVSGLQPA